MIVDYTVSISTIIQAVGFLVGGIFAFSRVLGQLSIIKAEVGKLETVPISIAELKLKILFLEQRVEKLETEKRIHVAA